MFLSPLITSIGLVVLLIFLMKIIGNWMRKVATIDCIPGPGKSFLLGNLPLQVLGHCIRPSADAQRFYHGTRLCDRQDMCFNCLTPQD